MELIWIPFVFIGIIVTSQLHNIVIELRYKNTLDKEHNDLLKKIHKIL